VLEGALKKEAGLENTLPKMVESSKAHSKRRKIGLESILSE